MATSVRARIVETLGRVYVSEGFEEDREYGCFAKRVDNGLLIVFDGLTEERLQWQQLQAELQADAVVDELRRTGLPLPSTLTTIQATIESPRPRPFRRPVVLAYLDRADPEASAHEHASNANLLLMRWWQTVSTLDRLLTVMRESYQFQLEEPGAHAPYEAGSWAIVEHLCGHTDLARTQFSAWTANHWFPERQETKLWRAQVERILGSS